MCDRFPGKFDVQTSCKPSNYVLGQEPITLSVHLPYCVCETAFSQVNLFLDKLYPGIGFK